MTYAMQGFLPAEKGCNIEYTRPEFSPHQHNAQGKKDISGLNLYTCRNFFEFIFQGACFPLGNQLQLADKLGKEKLFTFIPFWLNSACVYGFRGFEKERSLLHEIRQQDATVFHQFED